MKSYASIDAYIKNFPAATQRQLKLLRKTIQAAAPDAGEAIKYGIPTFTFHGNLVHFGAFKTHLSFFPTSSPITAFKKELAKYETAKGTIQLPLDKPLPLRLITKIVKFRVKETLARSKKNK